MSTRSTTMTSVKRAAAGLSAAVLLLGGSACATEPLADLAGSAPVASNVVDFSGGQTDLPEEVYGEPVSGGPVEIEIDGQVGQIAPVGLTDDGVLHPPQDVGLLGWYLDSALPGSEGSGSVVLTGHINDVHQGWGFASHFAEVDQGTEITVTTEGGGQLRYVAMADSELDPKDDGVAKVVNDFTGPERLVMITCGGKYVGGSVGYESNIITVFEPVMD